MKNRIFFVLGLILFLTCNYSSAQIVSYNYRPLTPEGCYVQYSVAKQNDTYYIIATISSDSMRFLKKSTMMVRTANGEVLKFNGELLDNESETTGVMIGYMIIPATSIISTAQFEVSPEQFELIKDGIVKVRLSTTPIEHEREFKKDKIGWELYDLYKSCKKKEDNF